MSDNEQEAVRNHYECPLPAGEIMTEDEFAEHVAELPAIVGRKMSESDWWAACEATLPAAHRLIDHNKRLTAQRDELLETVERLKSEVEHQQSEADYFRTELHKLKPPPDFKDHGIDITGGVESSEYVRRLRDET